MCHGTSLCCGLSRRRTAVSSSPSKPPSCQRLLTSMLVCARPGGVSSRPGQVADFPPQPFGGLPWLPAALGRRRGAHVGLLPALPKSFCLPLCWEEKESSPPPPAEEWPRVPQLRAGVHQGSCRPVGQGVACCHCGGKPAAQPQPK